MIINQISICNRGIDMFQTYVCGAQLNPVTNPFCCPSITRCWITDNTVHYVVNIGYYALVFVFTLGIFIVVVQRILMARKLKVKDVKTPSATKNLMAIASLLALLGLTWGVAFFSYGSMVLPSYYIFCILNAFQGNCKQTMMCLDVVSKGRKSTDAKFKSLSFNRER